MPKDLFVAHGLHGLHEWPEAQDAAVALLTARRKAAEKGESEVGGVSVRVTSTSGFTLRKVFYSVPSRLIGHRLRVHLFDDRLDLFIGGTFLMTLPRGRATPDGRHGKVVDYHHLIHSLRKKPMALLGLVYRDQLFPRAAFRQTFDRLRETLTDRASCRIMVGLLALAHDRACEADLATLLEDNLAAGRLPEPARRRSSAPGTWHESDPSGIARPSAYGTGVADRIPDLRSWAARLDEGSAGSDCRNPLAHRLGDELGTVVGTDVPRHAA
jgi:hypothetical protein